MKKYIFLVVCVFISYFSYADKTQQAESLIINVPAHNALDSRFAVNTELRNRNKANYFNYAVLAPQKTREQIAREKFITFLIWLGGVLCFGCICLMVFRLVKNKIALHIKQRAGKHTLDDVFAAEKKE